MVEKVSVKKVRKNKKDSNNKDSNNKDSNNKEGDTVVNIPKKRGRKPKGGKIVKKELNFEDSVVDEQVVILHLKCKMSELNDSIFGNINSQINYDPNIIKEVKAYSTNDSDNYYKLNNNEHEEVVYNVIDENKHNSIIEQSDVLEKESTTKEKQKCKKNIHNKLKELEILFNNNTINKKSDCFWCTCGFSTSPIYIPSLYYKEKYDVYGCFCSPECAASYLFKENIDNNTKFERYQLLNYLYGKIYKYEKEIKFAPDPYHTLDKYYGNLTIQEYRQLLEYDRLILVINKPVSKVYPEIHEDNNHFETVYENKLSLKKGIKPDKNDILNNVFSISNA